MSKTLPKLDNVSKAVRATARIGLHVHSRRRAASGTWGVNICGNKTSTGC